MYTWEQNQWDSIHNVHVIVMYGCKLNDTLWQSKKVTSPWMNFTTEIASLSPWVVCISLSSLGQHLLTSGKNSPTSINLKFGFILNAVVFNNETVAKFTQEIVHVIFLFTTWYTWIEGVAWFGLRAEVHALSVEHRLDTKLHRIHLFSVFTIKTPRTCAHVS